MQQYYHSIKSHYASEQILDRTLIIDYSDKLSIIRNELAINPLEGYNPVNINTIANNTAVKYGTTMPIQYVDNGNISQVVAIADDDIKIYHYDDNMRIYPLYIFIQQINDGINVHAQIYTV